MRIELGDHILASSYYTLERVPCFNGIRTVTDTRYEGVEGIVDDVCRGDDDEIDELVLRRNGDVVYVDIIDVVEINGERLLSGVDELELLAYKGPAAIDEYDERLQAARDNRREFSQ